MASAGFDQPNERVRQLDLVESQAERRKNCLRENV